jgi:AraC-like DNA-binding protein
VASVPTARHLLRAKGLVDARYFEALDVDDLAAAAGLSRAHFSREFRRAFGESPHAYLLTRRLERAAALLRTTDRSVTAICFEVGLNSVGSFTSSFTRTYGMTPSAYRDAHPPASQLAQVPACVLRAYGRPQRRTFGEADETGGPLPGLLRKAASPRRRVHRGARGARPYGIDAAVHDPSGNHIRLTQVREMATT